VAADGKDGVVLFLVENMSVPADTRVWAECLVVKDAGFDVVVICPKGKTRDTESCVVLDGITIHRFRLSSSEGGIGGHLAEYWHAFWHIRRLARRVARKHSISVVHAANPPDFLFLAAYFLRRRGASFVFDQHDLAPELFEARFGDRLRILRALLRLLERLSYWLADGVIVPNDSYRRVALTRGKKNGSDVFVVRNGPNPTIFLPGPGDPRLKAGKPHLLAYVGSMNAQDGVEYAIRALAVVAAERRDWHAVFAGDGDAVDDAKRLANELGISDLTEFPGVLARVDVVRLLSTADICLSPEPSSALNDVSTFIKVAEYMSMERPLVAFDLPESRFTAGEAATYAPPNDVRAFGSKILELLRDPAQRAKLGSAGRARVVAQLSWEHSAVSLRAAYERVLHEGRTRSQRV
jgi:glycosyltransferase involved in cell wall biosynthesis